MSDIKLRSTILWDGLNHKWKSLSSKPDHVLRLKSKTPRGTTWQCRRKQNFHVPAIQARWTGRTTGGRKGEKEGDLSTQSFAEKNTQQCAGSLKYQYSLEMQNTSEQVHFEPSVLFRKKDHTLHFFINSQALFRDSGFRDFTALFFSWLFSYHLLHKLSDFGCSTL